MPAEAEALREKRRPEPAADSSRPPHSPLPSPLLTTSPPLPSPSCCRRVRLGDPEPLSGYTALRPLPRVPMGRSGRDSAGVFSPGPGHERGPEKGTGGQGGWFRERNPRRLGTLWAARAPPHAPTGRSLTAPKPANHGPPFSVRSVQSQPPFQSGRGPANLSPLSRGPAPQPGPTPPYA